MNIRIVFFALLVIGSARISAQNVGVGNTAPASKIDVSGDIALREGTALTVAAGSNTLTLPTAKNSVYRLTGASSSFTITGISTANDGMLLTLINATGQIMTVNNGSNIQTNTGANLVAIGTASAVNLLYNATLSKWLVVSGEGFPATAATTNTLTNPTNTITSTVNGVAATAAAVNTVGNTSTVNSLSTTVNGVAGTAVPIVNTISNASSVNTLTTTVNGQTSTGAPIINSNTLSLSGTNLTSTVNGLGSNALDISSIDKNIYNADGTLTGTRTVTMAANSLTFSSTTGNLIFSPTSTANLVVGSGDGTGAPAGTTLRGPNAGSGNTAGGTLTLNAGFAFGSGAGGSVFMNGGTSGSGTNGNIYLRGGYSSSSQGAVYLNDDHAGNTFIDAAGGIVTVGKATAGSAQLTINNGLSVDAASTNNGTISSLNTATTGNAITFGGSGSGEGVASNRANATAGQNQYGVDLYTSFTRRLSVTNGGNVGINTTLPNSKFHVLHTSSTDGITIQNTTGGSGAAANLSFATYADATAGTTRPGARISALDDGSYSAHLTFNTKVTGADANSLTERMRISNTGLVSINNTTSSNTLNVGATTGLGNGIDIGVPNDQLGNNGSSYAIRFYGYRDVATYNITAKISAQRTYICCAGSGSTPWLEQGTDLVFSTTNNPNGNGSAAAPLDNSTERMRIKDNGFVGIGTSNPGYALDVNGTTAVSGNQSYGRLNSSQSGNTSGSYSISPTINASNDIRAGSGFYAFSDRRIKKQIEPIPTQSALDKINSIQPVAYGFIDSFYRPARRTVGFIAQDIERVIPEAVSTLSDYIPNVLTEAEACMIDGRMILDFSTAKPLATGSMLKVYRSNGAATSLSIDSRINDAVYHVSGTGIDTEPVFAFGTQVSDFRSVDYDKVFTIAVGAVQELSKRLAEEQAKNQTLTKKLSAVEQDNRTTKSDIDKLKASVETLQQIVGAKAQK